MVEQSAGSIKINSSRINRGSNTLLKKGLIGLGIAFIAIIIIVVVLISYLAGQGTKLDQESKEYVDNAVPIINKEWNEKELRRRASNEFMSMTSDEELKKMFKYIEKNLGKMKVYLGSQGESRVFLNNFKKDITANYIAQGDFEKGRANIYVSLIWKNNKWEILGYRVTSEVFKPY